MIELGADGIRLRTKVMDYDVMDEDFYREYGKPYDVAVLSASSGWCDIFSLSGLFDDGRIKELSGRYLTPG